MKARLAALALIVTVAATLTWQWRSAVDEAATMRQQATELRQALEETEAEASQARETIDRLSAAVELQREQAKKAEAERRESRQRLSKMETENEDVANWADAAVPSDVRDWLRDNRTDDSDRH